MLYHCGLLDSEAVSNYDAIGNKDCSAAIKETVIPRHEEICPGLRLRILLALLHWAGSTFNQSQRQNLRDMLKVVAWIPVADRCLGDIISFSHFQATCTGHFMLFPYFHISIHQIALADEFAAGARWMPHLPNDAELKKL